MVQWEGPFVNGGRWCIHRFNIKGEHAGLFIKCTLFNGFDPVILLLERGKNTSKPESHTNICVRLITVYWVIGRTGNSPFLQEQDDVKLLQVNQVVSTLRDLRRCLWGHQVLEHSEKNKIENYKNRTHIFAKTVYLWSVIYLSYSSDILVRRFNGYLKKILHMSPIF